MTVNEFDEKLREITQYSIENREDCLMITGMLEELTEEVEETGIE